MEGLKVKCPSCKKIMHRTTEHFDPNIRCNGSMLRLIDPWRKWGWCSFGAEGDGRLPKQAEVKSTLASDMRCPSCDASLAPSGHLTVLNKDGTLFIAPELIKKEPEPTRYWSEQMSLDTVQKIPNPNREKDVPQVLEVSGKSRDRAILKMLAQKKTQGDVAKELGISNGRVSQIVKRLKKRKK